MILTKKHPKRYAIFVFYDGEGIVDDYSTYFLRELQKVTDRILCIVNGKVTEEGIKKLQACSSEVLVRENKGLDITAYNLGLFRDGYDTLCSYDEAIVCNATVFGPFYPFSEMFDSMAKRDLDFWGISAFHEIPFDPNGTCKYHYLPQHLQSYFHVFRQDFMKTDDFRNWWKDLPEIHTYGEAIGFHEAIFTKEMSDRGYKWAAYCDPAPFEGFTWDPLRDFPRYQFEKQRCPIIKRRSFFQDYEEAFLRSGGECTLEALDYIRDHFDYDVDMIWKNLLRTEHMAEMKRRMHLNYILSSKLRLNKQPSEMTCALIIHLYYDDQAAVCREYAAHMPKGSDIYITVPDEAKREKARNAFRGLEEDYRIEYRITGNRGRDIAPFLCGCADVFLKYDLVCKIHDKKTRQTQPPTIGQSWGHMLYENVLHNDVFVENVIETFRKNPRLGMMMPPPPLHGPYFPTTGENEWGRNYKVTRELADQLKLKAPMSEKLEPIAPLGSVFWVRTDALRPMFEYGWKYEDFPEEPIDIDATVLHAIERLFPYCAQSQGYYSAWLLADSYAGTHIDNWSYINSGLELEESRRIQTFQEFHNFLDLVSKS
ncbi:MAG: rhamnan synthesis F family protein [Lachnospiraceae bacterium]|nr:rhamnan synthesis F family protein [Lachnospiraceae bacterium]MCI1726465.1 rhamnan synthesis F family protein [Lachnospiraceae bacterium]